MKSPAKSILVLIAVLIGAFIAAKFMFTRPPEKIQMTPATPPAPEGHGKGDYSPVSVARDQARKLTNALRDFHAKRGHRPLPEGSSTDEKNVFPINPAMLDALNGKDTVLNTAGVNYLKGAGITTLVPPGRFFAAFDFNGDGSIPDPASPEKTVSQDILVWSAGEDEKPETWHDNAFAWQRQ